jgi:serine/threonine protein kinase
MTKDAPDKPEQTRSQEGDAASSAREKVIAQVLAEFVDRQARDEQIDVESFCASHPDFAPELRPLLDSLTQMDLEADGDQDSSHFNYNEHDVAPLPKQLSGYDILGEIGAGGMGRVLLAFDEGLHRRVAIKTLSPRFSGNEVLRTRFMQEARALARLRHPNVVSIYSLGRPEEPPHFVMEYIEGATLLDASRVLTLKQKVELMEKVVLAVAFLHGHDILHRDLKPANILVGADLEPKLLDFGLARLVDGGEGRITQVGEVIGTPDYFSPEHTRSGVSLDARSDVFSLGTIFYELLTGTLPFPGESIRERMHLIREVDPVLPRRLASGLPGDLQNICLKALEKNPADRFASAKEMAADLQRFLAGEKVLALPTAYSHVMSGKVEQHLRELEGWRQDEILSDQEYDSLRKAYGRLIEREDAWILEARRLSLPQVSLYLGAWILTVGAALLFLFHFRRLSGTPAVLVVGLTCSLIGWGGIRLWKKGQLRIALAYLLAFCLLLPIVLLVVMGEYHFGAKPAKNEQWELLWNLSDTYRKTTNAQLWWSLFLSLPAYIWLRRFTSSSVFSLVFATMTAILCHITLFRFGLMDHVDEDPGWYYFRLIPIALAYFVAAFTIEHLKFPNDSRYFYPFAVVFTLVSMSGLAGYHEPYHSWLKNEFPWTRGQIEYLFIINAGTLYVLHLLCGRFPSSQMRTVAKSFRFFIPGHVLTSVLFLGIEAQRLWHNHLGDLHLKHEARFFEILLPVLACAFTYGSIPKQMKNYFVSGMLFLAVGLIRLQQDIFESRARLAFSLLILGLLLLLFATRYSTVKMYIARMARRRA